MLKRYAPHLLSLSVGFLSLSVEILWIRLVSFAHYSVPQAFAFVLGTYLVGIALGAELGKHLCAGRMPLWRVSAVLLGIAGLFDLAAPSVYAQFVSEPYEHLLLPLVLIALAFWKSALFPIAHHLGTSTEFARVGRSVSGVYVCNIVGAALGPVVTGFFLLESFSLQSCLMLMGWLCLLVAAICALYEWGFRKAWLVLGVPICLFPLVGAPNRLLLPFTAPTGLPVRNLLENKHGIIHTYADTRNGDPIYGGNVYDGKMNLDPAANSNGLDRAMRAIAAHPNPKRVLVVGLSGGAWTKLMTGLSSVTEIDVVEINPGYVSVIQDYSHKDFLDDKRVKVHTDDARRWLRLRPEFKYDLIIMNTTWHWRAYVTNLLSEQFLRQLDRHMMPNAILAFNSTGSVDVLRTATEVFPHAYRYSNFVYASRTDFRAETASAGARERLLAIRLQGQQYLDPGSPPVAAMIDLIMKTPYATIRQDEKHSGRKARVITDENMITEFRHGRGFLR